MPEIHAHGLGVAVPDGWEAGIFLRPPSPGEASQPTMHVASFPLPPHCGDFGAEAVVLMGPDDAFFALFEYGRESAGTALFSARGLPRALKPRDFSPATLQRPVPGQVGVQRFFTEGGRAFCLYAVLGSGRLRGPLTQQVNAVLATVTVQP